MFPGSSLAERPDQELGLNYLNIGDSIAFGLRADPGLSYFDLYSDYLWGEKFEFETSTNLGMPGLDSMELLGWLEVEQPTAFKAAIACADVITISIGGNNLLTPVIASTFGMYGLNPGTNTMQDLIAAILTGGKAGWDPRLGQFTTSALSSEPLTLGYALEMREAQFLEDWPAILDKIEELNPDAQIIAMTLYNPIEQEDNEALFNRYEELVRPMNKAMKRTQNRVVLVDVAKAFSKELDAVDFKLTWTTETPPVMVDPHPTTFGHQIIFEELMNARNPMAFK
jgi:lysophospholipase L1-like esterase